MAGSMAAPPPVLRVTRRALVLGQSLMAAHRNTTPLENFGLRQTSRKTHFRV